MGRDGINYVSDNDIMFGAGDGTFNPDGEMTRAMMAQTIYNWVGLPSVSTDSGFSDVPSSEWYAKAVTWVKKNKIMAGDGSGEFRPNEFISRQNAMIVLRNYAQNYKGYNVDKTTDISKYSDASEVTSYAKSSVQWAVATGLMNGSDKNELLPNDTLTRAQIAVLVTNFGVNIEHIVFGKDNYSFSNSSIYFTNSCYYITDKQYQTLCAYAKKYYAEYPDAYISLITDDRNSKWSGSCYGMAATTILDKLGKIDINGNYATNAKTIYSITGKAGSAVESAINYYQLAQRFAFIRNMDYWSASFHDQCKQAVDDCMNSGVSLFCYYVRSGDQEYGHAVVVYDVQTNSNGDYVLLAYDNRTPTTALQIVIKSDFESCTTSWGETVTGIEVVTDFAPFDKIDIDAELNDIPTFNMPNYSAPTATDVEFDVSMTGNFSITNAEGETLTWNNGELSGTMPVSEEYSTAGEPATHIFRVSSSSSFTYTQLSGGETYISLIGKAGYTRVSGTNISSFTLDDTKKVRLNGTNIQYEIARGAGSDIQTVSGSGSGTIVE